MGVTMESAIFMGKNYQNNRNSIANTTDLKPQQMFDINAKLVTEQEEISGLVTTGWENHSWQYMSLIGDERIINLQHTKVYVFSHFVMCLGKIHKDLESNTACEERIGWITTSHSYRIFDGIDGEPTKFEWNIFPGLDTLQENSHVDEWNHLFVFVQHQPFQFHQQLQSDVEKNAKRISHSKMQRKDSRCASFYCIRKPEENQI